MIQSEKKRKIVSSILSVKLEIKLIGRYLNLLLCLNFVVQNFNLYHFVTFL